MDDTTTETEDTPTDVVDLDTPQEPTPHVETEEEQPDESLEDDDQHDDERGGGKEAAKYRRQLRATETERDQLRDHLAAQRRAMIDWRSSNAVGGAVDPQLLDAAGIDVDTLVDQETGHLDMAAVDAFIDSTAVKFRVHRVVKPNPQQGQPSQGGGGASWTDVIKQGVKSR